MAMGVSSGRDLTTVVGIAVGLLLVAYAISLGGSALAFVDFAAVLIVVFGTTAITSACFTWGDMISLAVSLKTIIFLKINTPHDMATEVMRLSEHAKKKGVLELQDYEDDIDKNTVLFRGVRMLVDGAKIEEMEPVLIQSVQNTLDRNHKAASVLRKGAEIAPAMGLIGTLIGLVQMLGQLDDPSKIGGPMAVALLTTLYGALLAFMFLTPLASKIERNSDEELIINKIFLTAVLSIGKLESPRKLQTALNAILPPEQKLNIYR